jgi:hypothetical protein
MKYLGALRPVAHFGLWMNVHAAELLKVGAHLGLLALPIGLTGYPTRDLLRIRRALYRLTEKA